MQDCIFCKISKGELPCHKVYEDDRFLSFLDIYPRTRGHALLIPKKHYRWVYDIPEFDSYWLVAQKITKAMMGRLSPHFVTYVTHGLEIPHAHIHIMPRTASETAFVPPQISVPDDDMKSIADKLYSALKHDKKHK